MTLVYNLFLRVQNIEFRKYPEAWNIRVFLQFKGVLKFVFTISGCLKIQGCCNETEKTAEVHWYNKFHCFDSCIMNIVWYNQIKNELFYPYVKP